MSAMNRIRAGFTVLALHDNTGGDVSISRDGMLFAGPQDDYDMPLLDAAELEDLGWEFDKDIGRWGIRP